jgi:peptidyl-prolyl cis-trans isomerase D
MPSKEPNTPEKKNENVVKFKPSKEKGEAVAKKKNPITLTKIVTYVILGLLAVVLIVGVFPSFGQSGGSSTSIVFGTYDKEPIEFAIGNYFYRQYQTQAQQNRENSESATYQIWRAAFENTVFHTAVTQMADKAGIRVVDETLNQAIIDSGVYDKDGKFDATTYQNASVESKNQVVQQYTDTLPVQMVLEDISTIISSPAEVDYIITMGSTARAFEYVLFTADEYPDDLSVAYAQANPSLFTQIDVSMISLADEETANSVREQIASGTLSFADAARDNSLDGFATEGGRAGVWYLYELQSNFADPEEVNVLFSTSAGQVSQAFKTPSGYALYQVEADPWLADFSDADVINDIKTYIGTNDAGIVTEYIKEKAAAFASSDAVAEDFVAAATAAGLTVVPVAPTPANVGNSNYLSGFTYTDNQGVLTSLSSDIEAMRSLYSLPVGAVSEPYEVENTFVVAKVTEETTLSEDNSEYMRMIYPYLSQSQNQQDLIQSVFTSGKLVDDFFTVFLDKIMGLESN